MKCEVTNLCVTTAKADPALGTAVVPIAVKRPELCSDWTLSSGVELNRRKRQMRTDIRVSNRLCITIETT